MADVQLILPPQEWQFVADTARSAASFVVQLSGKHNAMQPAR